MDKVGELFGQGEYFVPELLLAARAMQSAMEVLRPILAASDYQPAGKVIMGTVQGDLLRHRQEAGGDDAGGQRL